MQIEKVSKYKPISTPSRSHEGATIRQMLISIPRLKWLEKDVDSCKYYRQYKNPDNVIKKLPVDIRKSPTWCATLNGQPLSPQEKKVDDLRNSMQPTAIGRALGLKVSTVRGMLARIRAKKGDL
jgi:hypothetical protein